jgi:hypothetical protein
MCEIQQRRPSSRSMAREGPFYKEVGVEARLEPEIEHTLGGLHLSIEAVQAVR